MTTSEKTSHDLLAMIRARIVFTDDQAELIRLALMLAFQEGEVAQLDQFEPMLNRIIRPTQTILTDKRDESAIIGRCYEYPELDPFDSHEPADGFPTDRRTP